ncbi:MAG: hypothetical protein DRI84_06750 [Bacteroidetes bacterium]|nr:MAG: hypothetical protein DRI84_06750 [Bacteroidota bacterium]
MNFFKKHILLFTIVSIAFLVSCSKTEQNPVLAVIDDGSVLYNEYVDHYLLSTQYKPDKFPTVENLKEIVELKAIEKMAVHEAYEEGIDKDSAYISIVNRNTRRLLFQKYILSGYTNLVVTDSLIKKFYNEYTPQYNMKYIMRPLVKTSTSKFIGMQKDTIEVAYKELLNGVEFGKVAGRYSQDVTSKEKGGDLGWIILESMGDHVVRSVMDTLKSNTYSVPFRGFGGYYILYKGDQRDIKVPPFESVKERIWKSLYRSRKGYIQAALDNKFTELASKYNYRLNEAAIEKALKIAGFTSNTSKYRELDFSKLSDKDKETKICEYDGGAILLGDLFANSKKSPINKIEFTKRLGSISEEHIFALDAKEINLQNIDEMPEQLESMRISLLRAILFQKKVEEKVKIKLKELNITKNPGKRTELKNKYRSEYEDYLKTKYNFSFKKENFATSIKLAIEKKKEQNFERNTKVNNRKK